MSGIDEYVRILFYREVTKLEGVPTNYVRRTEISTRIRAGVEKVLAAHKVNGITDAVNLSEQIFDDLAGAGIINELKDQFAGSYYRYIPDEYGNHRQSSLTGSDIYRISKLVGAPYFNDVFSAYRASAHQSVDSLPDGFRAPSLDRVVTLGEDQIGKFENGISHIIELVSKDDEFPAEDEIRNRMLGQLRAGRELVLAGTLRPYLLYATVLRSLGELSSRCQDNLIGKAARQLIDLLFDQLFKAA